MVASTGHGLVSDAANAIPWVLWGAEVAGDVPPLHGPELVSLTRATLLLALLAIILLGAGLIVLVVLGGRMVRRWARITPPSRVPVRVPTPPPRPLLIDDELDDDPHDTLPD